MNVELPENYYQSEGANKYALVRNGILELQGSWDFERLMVELTYLLKGRTRCFYCKREIDPGKVTIDHVFPRDFGGVTIPCNLEPSCASCNSKKSNLNKYEYKIWLTLSKDERKKFYQKTIKRKHKRKNNPKTKNGFDFPKKWLEYRKLDSIKKISKIDNRGSEKFKKMLTFARKAKKIPRPLIISRNNILLDGETAYMVAKTLNFKEVPVIALENVVVLRN